MTNKLVFIFFENGVQAILRGRNTLVDQAIRSAPSDFGSATELFQITREVESEKAEISQWISFLKEARKHDEMAITEEKYCLWRRHSKELWEKPGEKSRLCLLIVGKSGMHTTSEEETSLWENYLTHTKKERKK